MNQETHPYEQTNSNALIGTNPQANTNTGIQTNSAAQTNSQRQTHARTETKSEVDAETLHKTAVEIAKKFHEAESALIDILQKIDDKKIFLKLSYTSLFDYAVKALKLSEANASNFITIARKSKTVPELKKAIDAGEITVSKARKITPVITKENQSHWIELAKTLPKPKLEKEVARVMPQTLIQERARFVTESRMELKVGLSEDLVRKLRRTQDRVSQKLRKPASLEETMESLVAFFLERQDPLEKAKRNTGRSAEINAKRGLTGRDERDLRNPTEKHEETGAKKDSERHAQQNVTSHAKSTEPTESTKPLDADASVPGTRYIPAKIKHQIYLRDQAQCTYRDSKGQRCENKRWLEIHHQIPLFIGGSNNFDNLHTLCSAHHRQAHAPV